MSIKIKFLTISNICTVEKILDFCRNEYHA